MTKTIIGTMSGTSMDGIDAAVLISDGEAVFEPGATRFRPYSRDERQMIRSAVEACKGLEGRNAPAVLIAEAMITDAHAETIRALMGEAGLKATDVGLVGFHGQTLFHAPHQATTVQIGDGAALARDLGIPVAYDFRSADVAAGGEGAPLVPVFHKAILEKAGAPLPAAILNIGGVANITILTANALLAFDTGPGSALIDDWMKSRTSKSFDEWGRIAGEGRVNEIIVGAWLDHAYFDRAAPKSLDRNAFDVIAIDRASLADGAATLTALSARAMARAVKDHAVRTLFVAGGGAHNRTMMRMLKEASGLEPQPMERLALDGDFLEAQAFAYLAARVEKGLPISFPGTTGVKAAMTGGSIARP